MRPRRAVLALLAPVVAAGLVAAAASSAQAAAPTARTAVAAAATAGHSDPAGTVRALYTAAGFQQLVDDVTAQVRAEYPNARLIFIEGVSPSGLTTRLTDVTQWNLAYLAVSPERHPLYVSATVDLPDRTATITAVRSPVFGRTLPPVTMSPFEATVRARAAGFRQAYDTLWLSQPDGANPKWSFFGVSSQWTVDAVTGEVRSGL